MVCEHQSRARARGQFVCKLEWYGGRPWLGNCLDCIKHARNTKEAKAAFDAHSLVTHPPNRPRASGCCDRADQS